LLKRTRSNGFASDGSASFSPSPNAASAVVWWIVDRKFRPVVSRSRSRTLAAGLGSTAWYETTASSGR